MNSVRSCKTYFAYYLFVVARKELVLDLRRSALAVNY